MAHMSIFPAIENSTRFEVGIHESSINEQHSITITTDNDTLSLFLTLGQVETLFGRLNNYLDKVSA
jgi:hypothetical protein